MIIRTLSLLAVFVSSTAHASFFVDAPPTTIAREMAECFAEKDCAAQADRLIPLFAKSNGMTVAHLQETLNNCESPDSNMGFCVAYVVFAVKDELTEIVRVRLRKNPRDKAALPLRDMAVWGQRLENQCFREVSKEMPDAGGMYLREQVVACEMDRAIETVMRLR
jgi:hypothetical protein